MTRSLTIAYVGNFGPSHSTESHVAASFELIGHKVERIQENDTEGWRRLAEGGIADLDFVLWTRTWDLTPHPGVVLATMEALDAAGVLTVAFHLDKYWGLPRQDQIGDPWWHCNVVFSADGGNQDRFAAAGVNHRWLPPAVFGPECVSGQFRQEYAAQIGFVGGYNGYHPEWPYRRWLVDWLAQNYGRIEWGVNTQPPGRYRHFGGGLGPNVRGQDLNDAYASLGVVVGDSCNVDDTCCYWSDRIPETLGRGGFLLHPYVEGIEEHFTDGEHLVLFDRDDFDQLGRLVDHYVDRPEEARTIAARGQAHVRVHHTYEARMSEMLAVLDIEDLL